MSTPQPPLPPYKPYPLPGARCGVCSERLLEVQHEGRIRMPILGRHRGVDMPTVRCPHCDAPDSALTLSKMGFDKGPIDA